jgi:hypothetical protein
MRVVRHATFRCRARLRGRRSWPMLRARRAGGIRRRCLLFSLGRARRLRIGTGRARIGQVPVDTGVWSPSPQGRAQWLRLGISSLAVLAPGEREGTVGTWICALRYIFVVCSLKTRVSSRCIGGRRIRRLGKTVEGFSRALRWRLHR